MATYTSLQLQGSGSLITDVLNSSSTFKVTKTGGDQIVYLTFDVDGGSSTEVGSLGSSNFTKVDANGKNIYPAFSNTNFAYCLNKGTYNSGDIVIAGNLPSIGANTLRARIVGFGASGDTFLTIS